MISLVVLAATLWVCPGNVYSNEPKEGCTPFQESNKEGFSTVPEPRIEAPPADTAQPVPDQPPAQPAPTRSKPAQSTNSELCTLYAEYLQLTMKVSGGQLGSTSEDINRYEQLRNIFGMNNRPNCP
ncbi:MAG: hypothetical protein ACKOCD_07335 [Nitrospiraceae bacterium]